MFDIFYGNGRRNRPNDTHRAGPLGLLGSRECRCVNQQTGEETKISGCSRLFNTFRCKNCCRSSLGENWTGKVGFQRYGNRI